jgi:hypothetical protein
MSDNLQWLGEWFKNQADGEWEHVYGVELSTLDNPGWRVKVDLKDTAIEGARFEMIELQRTADDWLRCWVDGGLTFHGACGPENLMEIVTHFRNFVTQSDANQV